MSDDSPLPAQLRPLGLEITPAVVRAHCTFKAVRELYQQSAPGAAAADVYSRELSADEIDERVDSLYAEFVQLYAAVCGRSEPASPVPVAHAPSLPPVPLFSEAASPSPVRIASPKSSVSLPAAAASAASPEGEPVRSAPVRASPRAAAKSEAKRSPSAARPETKPESKASPSKAADSPASSKPSPAAALPSPASVAVAAKIPILAPRVCAFCAREEHYALDLAGAAGRLRDGDKAKVDSFVRAQAAFLLVDKESTRLVGPMRISAKRKSGGSTYKDEWVHFSCALWSPLAEFSDETGLDHTTVASEKCALCKKAGASNGCRVDECSRSYHLPCAVEHGCRLVGTPMLGVYCHSHISHGKAAIKSGHGDGPPSSASIAVGADAYSVRPERSAAKKEANGKPPPPPSAAAASKSGGKDAVASADSKQPATAASSPSKVSKATNAAGVAKRTKLSARPAHASGPSGSDEDASAPASKRIKTANGTPAAAAGAAGSPAGKAGAGAAASVQSPPSVRTNGSSLSALAASVSAKSGRSESPVALPVVRKRKRDAAAVKPTAAKPPGPAVDRSGLSPGPGIGATVSGRGSPAAAAGRSADASASLDHLLNDRRRSVTLSDLGGSGLDADGDATMQPPPEQGGARALIGREEREPSLDLRLFEPDEEAARQRASRLGSLGAEPESTAVGRGVAVGDAAKGTASSDGVSGSASGSGSSLLNNLLNGNGHHGGGDTTSAGGAGSYAAGGAGSGSGSAMPSAPRDWFAFLRGKAAPRQSVSQAALSAFSGFESDQRRLSALLGLSAPSQQHR